MLVEFDDCSFEGVPGSSAEHRHQQRRGGGLEAHLFPDMRDAQESDELEVVSLSLTRYGIGLEVAQDVPVGRIYNVEIGTGDHRVQSQFRIISCDPIADGLYRVGGEFC